MTVVTLQAFLTMGAAPTTPAAGDRSDKDAGQKNKKNQEGQGQLETTSEKVHGHGICILRGEEENQRKQDDSNEQLGVPPDLRSYAI